MFDLFYILFFLSPLVTIIVFWLLSFIATFFYKDDNNYIENSFYECGFKSITDFNFKININIYLMILLIVLYELEILFLVPVLINPCHIYNGIIQFYFFLFILFITISIDVVSDSIKWENK